MGETFVVPKERAGMELDEFLCLHFPGTSKGFLRNQVREGLVLVDGTQARPSQRLRNNQVLWVEIEERDVPPAPVAPTADVEILKETEDWMVVNKPAGMAVEPERWARSNASLSGGLLALALSRAGDAAEVQHRFRLVHRIDKDTSGAVLVAKNLETERFFRGAFERGTIRKVYAALVEGEHPLRDGETELIDLPLGPDAKKSGRMVVRSTGGKPSRTRVSVEQRFRGYTLLHCEPLTGRTHQIRVHLRERGFPLAVDPSYGRRDELFLSEIKPSYKAKPGRAERPLIGRQTLHARALSVPGEHGTVEVEAPFPKDFANTINQLNKVRAWNR